MLESTQWYYEAARGQQEGPVTDVEFQALRAAGKITPITRVWNASMAGWQAMQEIDSTLPETGKCSECGNAVPKGDLLQYGDVPICIGCKNVVVEKLQMGQQIGQGVWRDGSLVVAEKGRELPARCLKCNEPSAKAYQKKRAWLPPWTYLLLIFAFLGATLLVFLIVALCVQKKAKITVHLCERHRKQRVRSQWGMLACFMACPLFFGIMAVGFSEDGSGASGITFLILAILAFVGIFVFSIRGALLGTPKIIKDEMIYLKGAGEDFLDTLPSWTGESLGK